MRSQLNGLVQERADLIGEARAIFALTETEERDLNDGERTRDDEIQSRLDEIQGLIQRHERHARRDETPVQISTPQSAMPQGDTLPRSDPSMPFAEFGEQLVAIHRAATGGGIDERLYQAALSGAGEAVDSEGGFLVQTDFQAGIEKRMYDTGSLLSLMSPTAVSGNGLELTYLDETSRADGSRAGSIRGYWIDEGIAPTATQPKFGKIEWKLKKVGALGYAGDELLEDTTALTSIFTEAFADELTFMVEDSIINGDGVGKPQGILNAAATVSVTQETDQPSATINTTNLSKMWARLWARSRRNAIWLINQDIEPQLDELSIAAGTAALEPRFVTYGADGILRIKGRPILVTEYNPTLGTVGDILLIDPSQYKLITKGGVQQATSMHVKFDTNQMAFRATYRIDGHSKWAAALTPYKGGGNTVSPFISLATR